MRGRIRLLAGLCAAIAGSAALIGAQDTTRVDAASMARKIDTVNRRSTAPPPAANGPLRTSFTDNEVNAYFKVNGHDFLPEGVVNPQVTTDDGGRVHARATVDLDAVRKSQPRSLFSFLLTGSPELTVTGVLRASNGSGTFTIESVTIGGVPVPKALLQLVVTSYSKSPDMPNGFNLDQPFPLPLGIRAVEVQRGMSTVVQ